MRGLFALLFLTSSLSAAQSSGGLGLRGELRRAAAAPASVWVEMESDNKEAILIRHVGTAYGTVGGQSAVITTISKECVAPCQQYVEEPKSDFYVGGPGITTSAAFSLMNYPSGVKLKVNTGSSGLRTLGVILGILGVIAAGTGIPFILLNPVSATVQNPYGGSKSTMRDVGIGATIGGGAAILAAIPMIAFTGTKVEFFPLPAGPAPARDNASEI